MCNLHQCYTFCTGDTLFALVLHLNCTALSQSESSNFFMCIISGYKPLSQGNKNYFGYNLVHTPLLSTESESESSLVNLRRSMSCCCCWSNNFRSCCCFLMRRSLFIWCSWISNSVNFSCSSWSLSSSIRRCWCPSTTWFSCGVGASLVNDTIPVFSACIHKWRQPQRHTSTPLKALSYCTYKKIPMFSNKKKRSFLQKNKI